MVAVPLQPRGPVVRTVRVTVVEAPACHYCADALETLHSMALEMANTTADNPAPSTLLEIETVNLRDPRGAALVREHRAAMSPLVLVDGEFFSQGRLPRRKLEKLLRAPRPADGARVAIEGGVGRG